MDWNHWDRNARQSSCFNGHSANCNSSCAASASCAACGHSPCTCGNACSAAASCRENGCSNNRNTGCNSSCAAPAPCAACGHSPCTCGHTPAMVYETPHCLDGLHGIEEAIRKGTLFSELYMPMNGEYADACGAQLCDGQAEAFAAWELRLYLNTHPCDRQALELFRHYCRRGDLPNYACAFAFDDGCAERWSWTDAPWPWEHNAACENNCGCN